MPPEPFAICVSVFMNIYMYFYFFICIKHCQTTRCHQCHLAPPPPPPSIPFVPFQGCYYVLVLLNSWPGQLLSLNLCSSGALSQAGKLGQIFRWNANLSWLPVTSTYLQSTAVISDSIEYSNWGEGEIFFVGIKIRFLLAGKGGRQKKTVFLRSG